MRSPRYLVAPAVTTGGLVAAYLLVRPYGDAQAGRAMAEAFGSARWPIAHMCGAMGLAAFSWLALRLSDLDQSRAARWARAAGLAGAALVLPYFGAESFGLHALGADAQDGDLRALALVAEVRYQPLAITMFGAGLIALAVSAVAFAMAWSHLGCGSRRWAAWPLAVLMALFLPQFFLPASWRMAYGVAYLAAAVLYARSLTSADRSGSGR